MIVLVLTACPEGLRGHLTRWLFEISAGVFVGQVSRRVQDELWDRTVELSRNGRAILVASSRAEQGFSVRTHGHHWVPEDFEGITLLRRPPGHEEPGGEATAAPGWSTASRRRRYGRK